MKKLVFTMALCLAVFADASAQDVYKEILRLSKETAADVSRDLQTRKVATFKVDGLEYMWRLTREKMPDSLYTNIMNEQAYALYDYVNMFMTVYKSKEKEKERQEVIVMFMENSLNYPRFHDDDTEIAHAYILAEGYITKFSLDTDWVLAAEAIRKKLKETL